jgi:hypothetical protein
MNWNDEGYGDCEAGEAEWLEEQAVLQALEKECK